MAKKKSKAEQLESQLAELDAERERLAERIDELDTRLSSDEGASVAELRVIADELSSTRSLQRAVAQRLQGLEQQAEALREEARRAQLAALHSQEQDAFDAFAEAVGALRDGPIRQLMDVQRAVTDAGGWPVRAHRARNVVQAVGGFQRQQLMHANRDAHEKNVGLL